MNQKSDGLIQGNDTSQGKNSLQLLKDQAITLEKAQNEFQPPVYRITELSGLEGILKDH